MRCQRSRASAASAGLPSGLPWNSSSESAPMTRASVSRLATAAALAAASSATCSATRGARTVDSSTLLTTTSGARPAWRSSDSRAGEAEASTSRRSMLTRTSRRRASRRGRAGAAAGGRRRRTPTRRPASDDGAAPALRHRGDDDGQRGELLGGGLALDDAAGGVVAGVGARRVPAIGRRSGSTRLGGRHLAAVRPGGSRCHSGMFPCFLAGRVWRLLASTRSALVTCTRVCDGGMTAST